VSLRTLARRRVGLIFHLLQPRKHIENSLRGIRLARRRRYDAIDIDLQITEADPHCPLGPDDPEHVDGVCYGHVVGTHWARPMVQDGFHDPQHRIPRYTKVRRMTIAQVLRLVSGRSRINRIARLLRRCARLGVAAVVEPKGDPRFRQDRVWEYIVAVADDVGATLSVRALPENAAALPPARRAGAEAWQI
jgi:hypothetical protein